MPYKYQQRIICENGKEYYLEVILPDKPLTLQNTFVTEVGGTTQIKVGFGEATSSKEDVERLKQQGLIAEPSNELYFEYRVSHTSCRFKPESKLGLPDKEGVLQL